MTRHTLLFRIHVPPISKCFTSRILVTQTALLHMLTAQVYIACMVSLVLSYGFPFILHVLLCHVIIFMLYGCFLLLIWIFPLLDMRAVDMHYVEFHIYCSRFPLYCSRFPLYCSMLSTELMSCYHVTRIMYCNCSCYLVYLTHKDHLGMWETWRLIRSYRVDVWIHCSSHCRGRGSAGYHLLLMSIPLLF